jgi:uncharacterized protein YndB with AHSA1/START domain
MSKIKVEVTIAADLKTVFNCWTAPEHIMKWNFASEDWHCPKATNDLRIGGKFSSTMAAKDGSMAFDFEGVYDEVVIDSKIAYTLEDNRKVEITFEKNGDLTKVTEIFDPENQNSEDLQRTGWQMILNNFKSHVESL